MQVGMLRALFHMLRTFQDIWERIQSSAWVLVLTQGLGLPAEVEIKIHILSKYPDAFVSVGRESDKSIG